MSGEVDTSLESRSLERDVLSSCTVLYGEWGATGKYLKISYREILAVQAWSEELVPRSPMTPATESTPHSFYVLPDSSMPVAQLDLHHHDVICGGDVLSGASALVIGEQRACLLRAKNPRFQAWHPSRRIRTRLPV